MPGDEACIISGLNRATSEIILGLSARERGTFWYQGQGKLVGQKGRDQEKIETEENRNIGVRITNDVKNPIH